MKWIMPFIYLMVSIFLLRDIVTLFFGGSIRLGSMRIVYIGMFLLCVTTLVQQIKENRSGE